MRVIAGSAKGHRLQAPVGLDTRPTVDRIKESLFNIIGFDIAMCRFLDLFSGSGAIGIEALSRGAVSAVFIEQSPVATKSIYENLQRTKLQDRAFSYQEDVLKVLHKLEERGQQFDIIFMDPPYDYPLFESVLVGILEHNLLDQQGYIIVEHSTTCTLTIPPSLHIWKQKIYKTTTMSFLTLQEENV